MPLLQRREMTSYIIYVLQRNKTLTYFLLEESLYLRRGAKIVFPKHLHLKNQNKSVNKYYFKSWETTERQFSMPDIIYSNTNVFLFFYYDHSINLNQIIHLIDILLKGITHNNKTILMTPSWHFSYEKNKSKSLISRTHVVSIRLPSSEI